MGRWNTEPLFWSNVEVRQPHECWPWRKPLNTTGYGVFRLNNRIQKAHRVAYGFTYGSIPEGLVCRHKCDNRPCCNPSHLELGTVADNNKDRADRGRNADKRGTNNGRSAISEEDVRYIRANPEGLLQRELAARFGLTQVNISCILTRKTWRHIP